MNFTLRKEYLKYFFHIAVLAGLALAATKYINGKDTLTALYRFNWFYAPLVLALTTIYLGVKGWRFVLLLREVQTASANVIMRGYVAAQAATLLPGGIAARAGILEQAGVPLEKSAAATAHSSLSDQMILISCALFSALWFDAARKPALFLLTGLAFISLLLGFQATRSWLIGIIEWILHQVNLLSYWRKFLETMKEMASPIGLLSGLTNAALATALMVEALHLCAKGAGADIPYPTLLLAFTLPSLLGRISAMPGGVGVTEAGMIGVLDAHPGISREQAAAAVIVFRIGTVLFAALCGALCYFLGWKGNQENALKPETPGA